MRRKPEPRKAVYEIRLRTDSLYGRTKHMKNTNDIADTQAGS